MVSGKREASPAPIAGGGPGAGAEFVHPTFAEGLQTLVMRLPRYALR